MIAAPEPRTVFLGSKRQGLRVLRSLTEAGARWAGVLVLDDRADPRSVLDDFLALGSAADLPMAVVAGAAEARQCLLALKPDIALVCGWYRILDGDLLAAIPGGVYGLHNSLLPRYRGGAPLVWALIQGEREVGSTLFRMTPGMDDGPVAARFPVPVADDDDIGTVLARLEDRLCADLPGVWRALLDGRIQHQIQDENQATYGAQRQPGDGRIDWRWNARELHDFIRAQAPPYPGAFTRLAGRPVHILRAHPFSRPCFGTPGQVVRRQPGEVLIACGGGGALAVTRVRNPDGVTAPEQVFDSLAIRLP